MKGYIDTMRNLSLKIPTSRGVAACEEGHDVLPAQIYVQTEVDIAEHSAAWTANFMAMALSVIRGEADIPVLTEAFKENMTVLDIDEDRIRKKACIYGTMEATNFHAAACWFAENALTLYLLLSGDTSPHRRFDILTVSPFFADDRGCHAAGTVGYWGLYAVVPHASKEKLEGEAIYGGPGTAQFLKNIGKPVIRTDGAVRNNLILLNGIDPGRMVRTRTLIKQYSQSGLSRRALYIEEIGPIGETTQKLEEDARERAAEIFPEIDYEGLKAAAGRFR